MSIAQGGSHVERGVADVKAEKIAKIECEEGVHLILVAFAWL